MWCFILHYQLDENSGGKNKIWMYEWLLYFSFAFFFYYNNACTLTLIYFIFILFMFWLLLSLLSWTINQEWYFKLEDQWNNLYSYTNISNIRGSYLKIFEARATKNTKFSILYGASQISLKQEFSWWCLRVEHKLEPWWT